jgi:hypothetical protein
MFLRSRARPVRTADILIAICESIVLDNILPLTSHKPIRLQGLLRG